MKLPFHIRKHWRLYLASICVFTSLTVVYFDRETPDLWVFDRSTFASRANAAYRESFAIGLSSPTALQDVPLNHAPILKFSLSGPDFVNGAFLTGISSYAVPSQGQFIVVLPEDAAVRPLAIFVEYLEENKPREQKDPPNIEIRRVEVIPTLRYVSPFNETYAKGDSRKLAAESAQAVKHKRVLVYVPIHPRVYGFYFQISRDGLSRRLGFGKQSFHFYYQNIEQLGIPDAVVIPKVESTKEPSTQRQDPIANQPVLSMSIDPSYGGHFDQVAPQAEANFITSRQWSTKYGESLHIEAEVVTDRMRLFVGLLSSALFTGIGFFLGSMEWSVKNRRKRKADEKNSDRHSKKPSKRD